MTLNLSENTASGKRRYSRPTPDTWREITDLFISGAYTLSELASRYGVSTRAIQIHTARYRAAAGREAPAVTTIAKAVTTASKLTKATHAACIEETKASAYDDACALQGLVAHALAALAFDPAIPATVRLRACDQAAVALERVHKLRRVILGMSREDDVADRPLPELPIRVMTDEEVRTLRNKQAADDGELIEPDDRSGIVSNIAMLDDEEGDLVEEGS